jgi:hypothetical protein
MVWTGGLLTDLRNKLCEERISLGLTETEAEVFRYNDFPWATKAVVPYRDWKQACPIPKCWDGVSCQGKLLLLLLLEAPLLCPSTPRQPLPVGTVAWDLPTELRGLSVGFCFCVLLWAPCALSFCWGGGRETRAGVEHKRKTVSVPSFSGSLCHPRMVSVGLPTFSCPCVLGFAAPHCGYPWRTLMAPFTSILQSASSVDSPLSGHQFFGP